MPPPRRHQRVELLLQRGVEPRDGLARRRAEGERDDGVAVEGHGDAALGLAETRREGLRPDSADRERDVAAVEDDAVPVHARGERRP